MGFLDSIGNGIGKIKEDMANKAAMNAQRKAEAAALDAQYRAYANSKAQEIANNILQYGDDSKGGFYGGIGVDKIMSFTKEFYDKILLPASSVQKSYISMYPYLDNKKLKYFINLFPNCQAEQNLFHLIDNRKQEFLVTDQNFYFKICLDENPNYFATGYVPCANINMFYLEKCNNFYIFKCDQVDLARIDVVDNREEDFITLNNYFQCIEKQDFEITDQEVNDLIREKIGKNIYSQIKKYMVYDDELMLYFAWGLDSLTAKDYIVCTTKQVIIMDRELFGATANVKQLYYEDITAMNTDQNSKSSDLTGMLLDAAITSLTNTCDLIIHFAGGMHKINTLIKPEAERVVAIYHQCRKEQKQAASQPTVIQQQPDVLDQIQKLAALKESGILSEEEFNQKKTELLSKL